jgi:soluble lytic murein transglycosylase-like protein
MLVSTAREVDRRLGNRFAGMSDTQVATALQNDNAYNIRLGAYYFAGGLREQNNNVRYALARYNGGNGALRPSNDCPGLKAFECKINQGGYVETENYVNNIMAVARRL